MYEGSKAFAENLICHSVSMFKLGVTVNRRPVSLFNVLIFYCWPFSPRQLIFLLGQMAFRYWRTCNRFNSMKLQRNEECWKSECLIFPVSHLFNILYTCIVYTAMVHRVKQPNWYVDNGVTGGFGSEDFRDVSYFGNNWEVIPNLIR